METRFVAWYVRDNGATGKSVHALGDVLAPDKEHASTRAAVLWPISGIKVEVGSEAEFTAAQEAASEPVTVVELHGLGTLPPPGAVGNATPDTPAAAQGEVIFPGVEESAWIRNAVESEHRSALEFVGYCREKSWGYGQQFFERMAQFLEGENNALAAASKAGLIREAETRG